jgi:phosphoribosylglycinamide formyltransferase-1
MAKLRLGVLVSGSGTNLQAILDAVAAGTLDAEVRVVISNRPTARALDRARAAGVTTSIISHREFADRESFDAQLVAALREADVTHVVLAGFMRILTPVLLDAYPWRIINIHPALLPAFPGVHAQRQALEYGAKVSGCTVHFVDSGTDTGPVIAQLSVPVLDGDTEETLGARILGEEHRLLVAVLATIAADRVHIVEGALGARPRVVAEDLSARLSKRDRA